MERLAMKQAVAKQCTNATDAMRLSRKIKSIVIAADK
jgi:hypothetical protein